jgi:hypothetical protein
MNFIKENLLDDLIICDQLIELYKNSDRKHKGISGDANLVQPKTKLSTDLSISPYDTQIANIDCIKNYFENLQRIVKGYTDEFEFCSQSNPWYITESFNIQHYKPNEGYFAWHYERSSNKTPFNNRHLAWMTYLNDVTDEGGTEFYYQKLKIEPKKGKTVIFPCDWTHTHRGVVSKTQDKYIITGWFNFVDRKEN